MISIGWIGLGSMGSPMAQRLLEAGYAVNAYNRSPEKASALAGAGARICGSPREAAEGSDVVFTMLRDAAAVGAVLEGPDGALAAAGAGKLIVDMSTVAPGESRAFAASARERGYGFLDAPVSGSVGAAKTGQLLILAGGEAGSVDRCRPLFAVLGRELLHFGPAGNGSAAKLTINLLLGIMGQGFAEALLFSERLGLERDLVLRMVSLSGMNNPLFQAKKDMYAQERFPPAFRLELMSKDLGLAASRARDAGLSLPLLDAADGIYREAAESGRGGEDMAAVYLELKGRNA